jgi:hypothetical protein
MKTLSNKEQLLNKNVFIFNTDVHILLSKSSINKTNDFNYLLVKYKSLKNHINGFSDDVTVNVKTYILNKYEGNKPNIYCKSKSKCLYLCNYKCKHKCECPASQHIITKKFIHNKNEEAYGKFMGSENITNELGWAYDGFYTTISNMIKGLSDNEYEDIDKKHLINNRLIIFQENHLDGEDDFNVYID